MTSSNHLFVFPETSREFLDQDLPCCFIPSLHTPSVVTSGDLKMAQTLLKEVVDKVSIPETREYAYTVLLDRMVDKLCNIAQPEPGKVVPQEVLVENLSQDQFFRYVREKDINDSPSTFGGVTFFIQLYPVENRFTFSMAYCCNEKDCKDRFDKSKARRICVNRADGGDLHEVSGYDQSISLVANIYLAIGKTLLCKFGKEGNIPKLSAISQHKHSLIELKKVHKYIAKHYAPVDTLSYLAVMD